MEIPRGRKCDTRDCPIPFLVREMDLRFGAADDALRLSREVLEKDLKHLNALREEVTADRARFIGKESYELWKQTINDRVKTLEDTHSTKNRNMWIALILSTGVSLFALIKEFIK